MRNYYPYPEPKSSLWYRPVLITAQLKSYTTVNLVNETLPDDDQDYACIVLVSKRGTEREILKKTPYNEAEKFFFSYYDQCKARGDEPVITYCSFD